MNPSTVQDTVARVINRVLVDSGRPARDIRAEDVLVRDLGLDSLDLAVLVVGLEEALGIDPFRQGAQAVPTFGELVAVYERYLADRSGQ